MSEHSVLKRAKGDAWLGGFANLLRHENSRWWRTRRCPQSDPGRPQPAM